jgi:hypothetical protein
VGILARLRVPYAYTRISMDLAVRIRRGCRRVRTARAPRWEAEARCCRWNPDEDERERDADFGDVAVAYSNKINSLL